MRYSSVDVTAECDLRCAHCYFYRNAPVGGDLEEEAFLAGLARVRDERGIECMLWLGGEPLLRPELLRRGVQLFQRNAVFTNGLRLPPPDLEAGVLVSLDGGPSVNDRLRGPGSWERIMGNLRRMEAPLVHCTLTAENAGCVREVTEGLKGIAGAIVFGLYTPRIGEVAGHVLTRRVRSAVIADLRRVREEYGGFVVNTPAMLDAMEGPPRAWLDACPYRHGEAVALDHRLRTKLPCSYGEGADCSRCGCVAMHLRAAAKAGDGEALAALRLVFRAR